MKEERLYRDCTLKIVFFHATKKHSDTVITNVNNSSRQKNDGVGQDAPLGVGQDAPLGKSCPMGYIIAKMIILYTLSYFMLNKTCLERPLPFTVALYYVVTEIMNIDI